MKTVLLHVHENAGMESCFQAAVSLARQQEAHLTCVQTMHLPYFPVDGGVSPKTLELLQASIEEPAHALRAALETRLGGEMISWDWRVRMGNAALEVVDEALLADVIVTSGGADSDRSAAGSLIVNGAVPVLTIPAQASNFDPSGPVMIAWKAAPEAANAVRHGLPLIQAASSVSIVAIAENAAGYPAADVAAYLSRHGVHADVQERQAMPSTPEALIAAACDLGASCIVMGGYGHSRARELVFGGVTREMLKHSPISLLLSH